MNHNHQNFLAQVQIIPLNQQHLPESVALLNSIFVEQEEKVETCFKASLNPDNYRNTLDRWKIIRLNYFLAIFNGRVIGNSGMYEMFDDPKTIWLGWTCVAPEYENRGLGKKLIAYVIKKARQQGHKQLKLHTVDIDYQRKAHRLYEKLGFQQIAGEKATEIGYNRLYYQLDLFSPNQSAV